MNYYIVNATTNWLWLDMEEPKTTFSVLYGAQKPTDIEWSAYVTRPNYPISPEHKGHWKHEERIPETAFELGYGYKGVIQAIPLPPKKKEQDAATMQIIDLLNNWVNEKNRETIARKDFLEVAKLIVKTITPVIN